MNNNDNNNGNDDAFSHFPILFVMLMEASHLIFPSLRCVGAGRAHAQQPLLHRRLRCSLSRQSRPRFPASCLPPVPSPVYQPLCIRLMFKCCIVNWRGVALCWPARYLLVWSWGSGFNVLKRRRSFKPRPSHTTVIRGEGGGERTAKDAGAWRWTPKGDYGKYLGGQQGRQRRCWPCTSMVAVGVNFPGRLSLMSASNIIIIRDFLLFCLFTPLPSFPPPLLFPYNFCCLLVICILGLWFFLAGSTSRVWGLSVWTYHHVLPGTRWSAASQPQTN